MINQKSLLGVIVILLISALILSGCSFQDFDVELSRFFDGVASEVSDFWNGLGQILPDFSSVLEGIMSSLSGVGDAIKDMFGNFSLF